MNFEIFPAIDLRNGRVVRLQHGDPNRQTVFSDDPAASADKWQQAGARWLHVVNLDGAFSEASTTNWQVLPQLTQTGISVQLGGGIRGISDVHRAVEAGVARVILGTAAIENPDLVNEVIETFGAERVVVGIDARDGKVKTRGWQTETSVTPVQLGRQMKGLGIRTAVYTDISRDGVLTGVNVASTVQLARETGLHVIASGGVASLEDVRSTRDCLADGIVGVIIGRALYDGRVDLGQAVAIAAA